jgi:regulator of CtrA degradation
MGQAATINPRIIESLYAEGLALSDEVRAAFRIGEFDSPDPEDAGRIALSCEALRTTTRMMHAVAWLLNFRAYCRGEISEFQLRRHGRLSPDFPIADPGRLELLTPQTCALIRSTEQFYARLARIDAGWRGREPGLPPAFQRLRERLRGAVG